MSSKPAPPAETTAIGFDDRLARLEALVRELETGGLPLEAAIERYQEGVRLLGECRSQIEGFQKRVEELTTAGAVPYAADPDAPAQSQDSPVGRAR